ncbi:MAG: virginiamycin B lyase [Paraglaciecola sp.]|jgi:virginiamycin B lyase
MIDLSGSPQIEKQIIDYLATNYPVNLRRTPILLSGNTEITFIERQTYTIRQRARDPIEANDGTICWAGQWANLVSQIKPKSGEMKEYKLPENAMPHTVTTDGMGKLDPKTGDVSEFKMPDDKVKDPHSTIFDRKGMFWFTLQHSNMIGRLNSINSEIKEWPSPSGRKSHPCALVVVDNIVWYNESGMWPDTLIRFDPSNKIFQSWAFLLATYMRALFGICAKPVTVHY